MVRNNDWREGVMRPRLERPAVVVDLHEGENMAGVFGRFMKEARRQGWTQEEIMEVVTEAKQCSYEDAFGVIAECTISK